MAILHETIMSLPDITIMGAFDSPITGVSIDTRSLNAGDLFVAFIGSLVDGHDYIPKAISRGASAVMASTSWDGCEVWEASIPLIITDDPVKSLADLASAHRDLFKIPVIAITGTNGKTSTKNLLAHILSKKFTVLSTDGNFNNHIGLPITLLQLDKTHEIAVIEMGASQKGDIKYLCEIAKPNQGLITNISLAHTEFFQTIGMIQSTKGELFDYLQEHNGKVFVNLDDALVAELGSATNNPVLYSFNEPCDNFFSLSGPDKKGCYDLHLGNVQAHLNQAGRVIGLNAGAAATSAKYNEIGVDQIQQALENYSGEKGRMEHELIGGVDFINDAYNANPASVKAGIETIAKMQVNSRKLLVFADMRELGSDSERLHIQAAEQMAAAGFDHIILFGREASFCAHHLAEQGLLSFFHSVDKLDCITYFLNVLESGDLVYLKGSRSMELESFIEAYKEAN
ncbi:MAG: UDP-N-acetylmuramoyl-tripeptide--D-alanyl-D-alanine ligase [Candidatus Marinimicrobia bacterium]|nr:UDP-N-acetylmuramoyl-tripeptide--D-alanyl-D-alanine ligase [Candidatus Neomarinimicrobiota bacterium]